MHKEYEKDNVETDIYMNGLKGLSYLIKVVYKNFLSWKVVFLEKMILLQEKLIKFCSVCVAGKYA